MEKDFIKGGARRVQSLIDAAVSDGSRAVTLCGNYEIEEAIRLPSDFTLTLENCHLRLADGSYTNIFVNEHHGTELGKTTDGTDRGIRIIGKGEAILDGGVYNGLSEKNAGKGGLPPIWKNNLILFTNVDGFMIDGISLINQRWWAANFIFARNGEIRNIKVMASDEAIDKNGRYYRGLRQDAYSDILIKNADGIDIRCGCNNILIENISGFTEDDTVALTGLMGALETEFCVAGLSTDISSITVKNVRGGAYCALVRLLNQDGISLHDVTVDGVYDSSLSMPQLDRGAYGVRIGDTHLYGKSRYPTPEETYNITVKNLYAEGMYALTLATSVKNLVIENVNAREGTVPLRDDRPTKSENNG